MSESKINETQAVPAGYGSFTMSTVPKYSDWKCYLFGSTEGWGMVYTPREGEEPNWFWRWTQYLAFGHRWVKKPEKG